MQKPNVLIFKRMTVAFAYRAKSVCGLLGMFFIVNVDIKQDKTKLLPRKQTLAEIAGRMERCSV